MVALAVYCIERRGQMRFVACNRNGIQNYYNISFAQHNI